jgi:hypothetical protein
MPSVQPSASLFRKAIAFRKIVQIHLGLVQRDNIGVFLLKIEQIGFVRALGAVADTLPYDHRTEARAHCIHRGGANAAARRTAADDQRVDAPAGKPTRQIGADESGWILLVDDRLAAP